MMELEVLVLANGGHPVGGGRVLDQIVDGTAKRRVDTTDCLDPSRHKAPLPPVPLALP